MTANPEPSRPSRLTALLITAGIGLAAGHDQLRDGSLSTTMAAALLVLVFFWTGRGGDALLTRLLDRWLK